MRFAIHQRVQKWLKWPATKKMGWWHDGERGGGLHRHWKDDSGGKHSLFKEQHMIKTYHIWQKGEGGSGELQKTRTDVI